MVKSILDKHLEYQEDSLIENDDKGSEMSSYYYQLNNNEIEILLGNKRTHYSDSKNIVYMPVYLIRNDTVDKKIGIFEIKANHLIQSIDDDGDIILENGNLLFFSNLDEEPEYIEKIMVPIKETSEVHYNDDIDNSRENKQLLLFDKTLEFEKKETHEELTKQYHVLSAHNWVEKVFKNHLFGKEDVSPNGDCFFLAIIKAYDGTGKHINVEQLRTHLSKQVTSDIFTQYYEIYAAITNENQRLSYNMNERKKQNKILKQRYENTLDKQDSLEIMKHGEVLRGKYNDDKINSNWNTSLLQEFIFMDGITTIQELKDVIKTNVFWADTWAIGEIENYLNIKTIILSNAAFDNGDIDNIILCGQINDINKVVREPEYYIILSYNGNHYDLITYNQKSLLTYKELPYIIRRSVIDKCLEKLSGPFYEITEFKKVRDKLDAIEKDEEEYHDPMDCNTNIIFVIHSKSNNVPRPGKGVGEKIDMNESMNFNLLHNEKQWRRKLDDSWTQPFNLDGKKWLSVKHYVYGSRYKKGFPDFYHMFSLSSDSKISKDIEFAIAAVSKSGKYKNNILRNEEIHADNDYNDNESREQSLISKFSQNPELQRVLALTNNACLKQYQRNVPTEDDNLLMKVRDSIIV
tara:strand:+ start:13 stop:1911 length:1899 start_codon:yes stop_codon:yes gene_type:complete